jgi:hypothetical protein
VLVLFIDGRVGCNSGSRRRSDEIHRLSWAVGGALVDDCELPLSIRGVGGTSGGREVGQALKRILCGHFYSRAASIFHPKNKLGCGNETVMVTQALDYGTIFIFTTRVSSFGDFRLLEKV